MDKSELLPHVMFEILSRFIEDECQPEELVDWYHEESNKKIIPGQPYSWEKADDPNAVWVRDEMQTLYDWWHNVYLKQADEEYNEWYAFFRKHATDRFEKLDTSDNETISEHDLLSWSHEWDTEENQEIGDAIFQKCRKLEEELEEQLRENMIRLCNLRPFLWT